jgi:hypothetical protein
MQNFRLKYSGTPGAVSASLFDVDNPGDPVAVENGLKDEKAARQWARSAANRIKAENAVDPDRQHEVTIQGRETFSV